MLHLLETDVGSCRYGYSEPEVTDLEISAAAAATDAFNMAERAYQATSHNDIWLPITDRFQGELVQLAREGRAAELARYLSTLGRQPGGHGFYLGKEAFDQIVGSREYCTGDLMRHLECLIGLGEATGCLKALPRKLGRVDPRLTQGVEPVLAQIEQHLGIDIVPPDILGGICGAVTERGILHMRHLNAVYAAWRLKTILDRSDEKTPLRVCEIGAGTGLVAYYCAQFGIDDFTIIDLKNLNIVQGYFVTVALGADGVSLFDTSGNYARPNRVRVLPEQRFFDAPDQYFDVMLNQDSFPEIDYPMAQRYLRDARRSTSSYVLSINQEFMGARSEKRTISSFSEHAGDAGGFHRLYRFPYWMRANYVEELWRVDPA